MNPNVVLCAIARLGTLLNRFFDRLDDNFLVDRFFPGHGFSNLKELKPVG